MSLRLFPGDRRVWIVAGAVLGVCLVIIGITLFKSREVVLGSSAVQPRGSIVTIQDKQRACTTDVMIPDGTARLRTWVIADTGTSPSSFDVLLRVHGGPTIRGTTGAVAPFVPMAPRDITLDQTIDAPGDTDAVMADLCFRSHGGALGLGGQNGLGSTERPLVIGKTELQNRLALTYLAREPQEKAVIAQLGTIFERASLFRPGFVGPWTFWLIFFVVFPLLAYFACRILALADSWRSRRIPLALAVALLSFGHTATWAIVLPAYQSPDESEHFAYVEHFAETGKATGSKGTEGKAPWATDEAFAIDAVHLLSTFESARVDLPWMPESERVYERRVEGKNLPRSDGGAAHPATEAHSPLYYAMLAPGYYITRSGSPFDELLATRLTSALMGAVTVLFTFLLISELLPRRRALAAAGALMVAFLPMFGFISGAVNNDNGVNMAAAAIAFLTVRLLRRGASMGTCLGLGVALGLAPLFKGTGYALYPCVALAVIAMILRAIHFDPRRLFDRDLLRSFSPLLFTVGAILVFYFGWDLLAPHVGRSDGFTTPAGSTPGVSFGAKNNLSGYASWIWQNFIPFRPSFMTDYTVVKWPFFNIYIERGFGSFGWYAFGFARWVYVLIVAILAILLAAALAAAIRHRDWVKARWPELLFLISVPVVVLLAIEAAYMPAAIPINGTAEQGRYLFTALAPIATILIGGCMGFGRRNALSVATGLVTGLVALAYAGQWLMLYTWFV